VAVRVRAAGRGDVRAAVEGEGQGGDAGRRACVRERSVVQAPHLEPVPDLVARERRRARVRAVAPRSHRLRRLVVPKLATGAADVGALALAMFLAYELGRVGSLPSPLTAGDYVVVGVVSLPAWLMVFARYGLYAARRITGRLQEFRAVFHAIVVGSALLAIGAYAFDLEVARRWVLLTFGLALVLVSIEREIVRGVFTRLRRRGRFLRRVVVIGANDEGRAIADMLDNAPSLGYHVVGFVDDAVSSNGITVLGGTGDTLDIVMQTRATGAIVATTSLDIETSNDLVRRLMEAGVHVELSSSLRDIASQRLLVRPLGAFPVVYLEPVRRHGWRAYAKRAFDLGAAATALMLLAPLLLAIALAVKATSRGPVLFRQQRLGKDGRIFTIYKFRTMVVDAEDQLHSVAARNEADGPLFKIREDPRVTGLGRFLRHMSLDELPQLWNVVRGEMSLVGPRPALPTEAEQWEPRLRNRLRVKPGLTGMWQVHGRADASFEAYMRLDLYYVDNWSLITDLGIIVRTIPVLLRRNGAY
jgi:exopolysaccharide biosynthesis polyprenyl glycosylphosphotransferase